jgi:HK97 family phage major capsid protein
MNEKIRKLREERLNAGSEMRKMLDLADSEKRCLTADETIKYEQFNKVIDDNAAKIEREERLLSLEKEMGEDANERITDNGKRSGNKRDFRTIVDAARRGGIEAISKEELKEARTIAFGNYLLTGEQNETRALQMDSDIYGGYLVAPEQFVSDLIKGVDNAVYIRRLATTYQVPDAVSLGQPSLDNDPADPTWTAEIATGTEDSTMSFGKRELHPHPLAKLIKVSNKLMRASGRAEGIVGDRLRYKFAVTDENAFFNGTGQNQPLGMMVASDDGITTSQDVSTGNTSSTITFDGLINCKYDMKAQYWSRIRWAFHRDALKQIRKLKDGESQYIWQQSVVADEPDTILGRPVIMSEYMPNTFSASQYVGLLADFSFYHIADALSVTIQRLVELYAATNQTGFIGRMETDGMPVLAEAFRRVKLSA